MTRDGEIFPKILRGGAGGRGEEGGGWGRGEGRVWRCLHYALQTG